MMFRDLKQGDTLYVYDRVAITLSAEKVVNVSAPHLDKNNVANGMMVDVTIGNVQYSFKDASEVGYTTNLVISPNRACVLREVKNHKTNNETQISMTPRLQEELPKLDVVIEELEPELKEKKEQDAKLAKLAEEIQSMKQMFEQALKQMSNGSKRVDTEI
ncbi:MAG: hypothetical protein E7077_06275 [Bacteroidales bacterium]|nr:hypothetical protein [Bacteroidales bacterium]